MIASVRVPGGSGPHSMGGEMFSPSQVNRTGMRPPWMKALLRMSMFMDHQPRRMMANDKLQNI
jgi:hypothetical protein